MYLIRESDIISWAQSNDLKFIQCACRFTENYTHSDDGVGNSKRQEMKALINDFRETNPEYVENIFKSVENVELDSLIGFHDNKITYSIT